MKKCITSMMNFSGGDKTLIPSDVDKVDMALLKKLKKQKNLCNNLIKKDIKKPWVRISIAEAQSKRYGKPLLTF